MTLRVHFYGRPSDIFGTRREVDIPPDGVLLSDLRRRLCDAEPMAEALFADHAVRAAVDEVIVAGDVRVRPGQSVEFFSVFSGG